jgi:hypothetical protein
LMNPPEQVWLLGLASTCVQLLILDSRGEKPPELRGCTASQRRGTSSRGSSQLLNRLYRSVNFFMK